ncbi:ABC transporter substrate-binding protein [Cetobacterium sp. ZOR0034]|uniref:ABC transporter substrate-binding protein n=1 Tax=Cetobacterium sp. ZOR0034 TaxID=1339239 RepID=UPI0006475969|nr:ABC transporter substrate-binding protein [Cetobacterium sp. ZOR0034]
MKKILVITLTLILTLLGGCEEKKIEKKDKLTFAQLSDPKTLDPQNSTDNYSQIAITQIYDRLFEIDEKTGTPIPSLVESYERVNDKILDIKLKKDVRFTNGDVLTSEDVKFTIERAKANPKVSHLYKMINNIVILSDNEFQIITEQAFSPLLNHLSHKSSSVINKKEVLKDESKYFENPIATGPYKVESWAIGDNITLSSNQNYYKGIPSIKTVVIKAVPEENSRVIGLETGEIDMSLDIPAISWNDLEKDGKIRVYSAPSTTTGYIGLNTNSSILSNKILRQAIALAIDKQSIVDTIYLGKTKVANQFLAPPVFGYNQKESDGEFNPEKARKILEDNDLIGTKLKIAVSSPERVQVATIIQDQLKKIGINLEIELLEWGAFLSQTGSGNTDMFIMGWGPSTYDADYGYYPNIHSSQLGSNGNRTFYSNLKVDELLEMARKESDNEKRKGYYIAIQKILNDEVPLIPLYHGNVVYGASTSLKNVSATGYPEFYKYEF